MTDVRWTVVVPVKGTAGAKSRLGADRQLADAIAVDTVNAAIRSGARVIVVTPAFSRVFDGLDVTLVDDPGTGLGDAVLHGLALAGAGPAAVLLGDVPAMLPEELRAALAAAAAFRRAFVADAEGSGTTLIAASSPALHEPRFGPGSSALHRAAGYVELPAPAGSGLRCDVDTVSDLAAIRARVGSATRAAMGGVLAGAAPAGEGGATTVA